MCVGANACVDIHYNFIATRRRANRVHILYFVKIVHFFLPIILAWYCWIYLYSCILFSTMWRLMELFDNKLIVRVCVCVHAWLCRCQHNIGTCQISLLRYCWSVRCFLVFIESLRCYSLRYTVVTNLRIITTLSLLLCQGLFSGITVRMFYCYTDVIILMLSESLAYMW